MVDIEIKNLVKTIFSVEQIEQKRFSTSLYERRSFRFRSSKIYALTGPKNTGKSMLIRLIIRLNDPDKGIIFLNGAPIQSIDLFEYRQHFSACLPGNHFFTSSSKEEISYLTRFETEMPFQNQKNRVLTMAGLVLFPQEKLNINPSLLNKEEKAKIQIARTLFGNSDCFLFDGTFDEINSQAGLKILGNLKSICRQEEKLLIFSTGNKDYQNIADEVIRLQLFD